MVTIDDNFREVDFYKYCKICKHSDLKGTEHPCCICLSNPVNEGTDKPVEWKEK